MFLSRYGPRGAGEEPFPCTINGLQVLELWHGCCLSRSCQAVGCHDGALVST